jgi:GTPase
LQYANLCMGDKGAFQIHFKYRPDFVEKVRNLTGRRYNKEGRYWEIPDNGVSSMETEARND